MKPLPTYSGLGLETPDEVFEYLVTTFHDNLREWDYFVNWSKAFENTGQVSELVEKWDQLIGVPDFNESFRSLLTEHPELSTTIPSLIVRDGSGTARFSIVTENPNWREGLRNFDFSLPAMSEGDVELALEFVSKSGLRRIFEDGGVSRVRDFLLGAEAGVDSHGRKNRGGNAMTHIVTKVLEDHCNDGGFELAREVSPNAISNMWGVDLSSLNPNRRFDFAMMRDGRVFVVEVNAYGGGGSKLKATAAEYIGLQAEIQDSPVIFVWITEGAGWRSTRRPLRKAFDSIDHVLNLRLIEHGALDDVLAGDR
jgi:type II restriction enzyme